MKSTKTTRNVNLITKDHTHPLQALVERALALGAILFIGMWMIQVFTNSANASNSDDVEEVYSNPEKGEVEEGDDDYARVDVRLTRPDEANSRLSEDGYAMVPGAERLNGGMDTSNIASNTSAASNRRIASLEFVDTPSRSQASSKTMAPVSQKYTAPIRNENSQYAETKMASKEVATVAMEKETFSQAGFVGSQNEIIKEDPKPVKPGVYQEISIIVSDHGYYPNRIFVTQNIPVRMYLTTPSSSTLCVMLDAWGVKKGVMPGKVEEVSFTPDQPGNYKFYCPVKGIEGTLTVRESRQAEMSSRNVASDEDETKVSKNQYQNGEAVRTELKQPKPLKMLSDDEIP